MFKFILILKMTEVLNIDKFLTFFLCLIIHNTILHFHLLLYTRQKSLFEVRYSFVFNPILKNKL